ncbi:MAG: DUF1778 domain-containing protein [Actinobacteria bacterium]|nr:DUF1778 domain-containing protein [Actinomycetota bacterium]
MPPKSDRIEARLSPDERALILRAAGFQGLSMSSFIVAAAVEKADQIITEQTVTRVPPDYFDQLLEALDEPESAPALERAVQKVRRRPRIR